MSRTAKGHSGTQKNTRIFNMAVERKGKRIKVELLCITYIAGLKAKHIALLSP